MKNYYVNQFLPWTDASLYLTTIGRALSTKVVIEEYLEGKQEDLRNLTSNETKVNKSKVDLIDREQT